MSPDGKAWHTAWEGWSEKAQTAHLPANVLLTLSVWFEKKRTANEASKEALLQDLEKRIESVVAEYQKRGTDAESSKNMVSELADLGVNRVLALQEQSRAALKESMLVLDSVVSAMAPSKNQVDPLMGFFYDPDYGLLGWMIEIARSARPTGRLPNWSAAIRTALKRPSQKGDIPHWMKEEIDVVAAWCSTGFFDKVSMELLWEEAVKKLELNEEESPRKGFEMKKCPTKLTQAIEIGGLRHEVKRKYISNMPHERPAL